MSIASVERVTNVLSELPDGQDLPLEGSTDEAQYAQLMRRIGLVKGEAGTPVSAFNSSI